MITLGIKTTFQKRSAFNHCNSVLSDVHLKRSLDSSDYNKFWVKQCT